MNARVPPRKGRSSDGPLCFEKAGETFLYPRFALQNGRSDHAHTAQRLGQCPYRQIVCRLILQFCEKRPLWGLFIVHRRSRFDASLKLRPFVLDRRMFWLFYLFGYRILQIRFPGLRQIKAVLYAAHGGGRGSAKHLKKCTQRGLTRLSISVLIYVFV